MRAWRLFAIHGGGWLFPTNVAPRPHENDAAAVCIMAERGDTEPHPVPAKDCRCGYYSLTLPYQAVANLRPETPEVVVEVEPWGIVQEHEYGLRSQHLKVVAVYAPANGLVRREVQRVVARYGCEMREERPEWRSESTQEQLMFQSGATIRLSHLPQFRITSPVSFQISSGIQIETAKESWFQLSDLFPGVGFVAGAPIQFILAALTSNLVNFGFGCAFILVTLLAVLGKRWLRTR